MVESLGFEPLLSQNVHQGNTDIATNFNSPKVETSSRNEGADVEMITEDHNVKRWEEKLIQKDGQLHAVSEGKQLVETTSDIGHAWFSQETNNTQKSRVGKPPNVDLSQSRKRNRLSTGKMMPVGSNSENRSNFGDGNISECEVVGEEVVDVTNVSSPLSWKAAEKPKAAQTNVQSNGDIAVGKLVKKLRRESGSSDEDIDQTPFEARHEDNKVRINPVSSKVEKISGKDFSESTEEEFNTKQTNDGERKKRKPKRVLMATTKRNISLVQVNARSKISRKIESSDSSDSEDSNEKRKGGVRAVRGLAALRMARKPSGPSPAKSTPRSPEVIVADDDCEVTIVEGTPLLSNSSRMGRLLKSQLQVKRNSKSVQKIEKIEQEIVTSECSTKNETQSQEIISDTPEERNDKRISPRTTPRKQLQNNVEQDNHTEEYVPTPREADQDENKLHCQEHSDDEMFEQSQGDGSYQSAQASSFEPGSESLLIPKTTGQTSKKELMENQTETNRDGDSTASFVPGNEFINQCSFKLTQVRHVETCRDKLMENTLLKK